MRQPKPFNSFPECPPLVFFCPVILVSKVHILAKNSGTPCFPNETPAFSTGPRVFHQTRRFPPDPTFSTGPRVFHQTPRFPHPGTPYPETPHPGTPAPRFPPSLSRNQANLHASEQIISAGIFVGAMD